MTQNKEIEGLAELQHLLDYPGLKEYVGSIIFDAALKRFHRLKAAHSRQAVDVEALKQECLEKCRHAQSPICKPTIVEAEAIRRVIDYLSQTSRLSEQEKG